MNRQERIATIHEMEALLKQPNPDEGRVAELRAKLEGKGEDAASRIEELLSKRMALTDEDICELYDLDVSAYRIGEAAILSTNSVKRILDSYGMFVTDEEVTEAKRELARIRQSFTAAEEREAARLIKNKPKLPTLKELEQLVAKFPSEDAITRKRIENPRIRKAREMLESDAYVSVKKVAEITGARVSTLYIYISSGRIVRPRKEVRA